MPEANVNARKFTVNFIINYMKRTFLFILSCYFCKFVSLNSPIYTPNRVGIHYKSFHYNKFRY